MKWKFQEYDDSKGIATVKVVDKKGPIIVSLMKKIFKRLSGQLKVKDTDIVVTVNSATSEVSIKCGDNKKKFMGQDDVKNFLKGLKAVAKQINNSLVYEAASTTFAQKADAIQEVLDHNDYKNSFCGKIERDEFYNNLKKIKLFDDFEKALEKLNYNIEEGAF